MPKSASAESLDVARFLLEAGGRDKPKQGNKSVCAPGTLSQKPAPRNAKSVQEVSKLAD